ncbi:MAG TPA: amidohydrolase family protein, partial [Gemmatimonadaceae bacterium]|nr:amidohydrolase family protein [Gemmatimonadaceae bacterium]
THAIDTFGIRRVLYGSDWPVCTLAGDVAQWRALVSAAVGLERSAGERDAVFGGNAMDAYRFSWPRTSA